jgi:hypothetical protein
MAKTCAKGHPVDNIGTDSIGRVWWWCAECGAEWLSDDPADADDVDEDDDEDTGCPMEDPDCLSRSDENHDACEAPTGPPVTSIEKQVYIDGGYAALKKYREDTAPDGPACGVCGIPNCEVM